LFPIIFLLCSGIGVDYVLCHESVKAKFLDLLKQTITQFYGKDPKSSPDYACVISDRQFQRIVGLIESDRSGLVFGGNYDATTRYVAPTIIEATGESKSMQEEIFGPILPLLTYKDIAEAINFINARPKPLALYCFSNSSSVNDRVLRSTTSGGASINDTLVHFGNKNLPFGGVGPSGMGSYHGKFSFLAFSHARGVVEKSVYGDAPARYPPYAADKLKLVQFFNSIKRFDSHTIRKLIRFVLIPLVLILIFRRLGLRVVFQRK
jgi:aldehyde dehydrogenase (NAD+)